MHNSINHLVSKFIIKWILYGSVWGRVSSSILRFRIELVARLAISYLMLTNANFFRGDRIQQVVNSTVSSARKFSVFLNFWSHLIFLWIKKNIAVNLCFCLHFPSVIHLQNPFEIMWTKLKLVHIYGGKIQLLLVLHFRLSQMPLFIQANMVYHVEKPYLFISPSPLPYMVMLVDFFLKSCKFS